MLAEINLLKVIKCIRMPNALYINIHDVEVPFAFILSRFMTNWGKLGMEILDVVNRENYHITKIYVSLILTCLSGT